MLRHTCQLLVIVILLTSIGCASLLRIDGPYEGRVIDAETNQPIEGAVVDATWDKKYLGGGSEYYDNCEVLTNTKGEFRIPGQGLLVFSDVAVMIPTVFKVGYNQLPICYWNSLNRCAGSMVSCNGKKVTIKLKKMAMEERRKRVVRTPDVLNNEKTKLFMREVNKEYIEAGKPNKSLYPSGLLK